MGWWNNLQMAWKYRGQEHIQRDEGSVLSSSKSEVYFERAYDHIEVIRRGADLICNSAAEIDVNIAGTLPTKPVHRNEDGSTARLRQKKLFNLLNHRPNEADDIHAYRRELILDFLITGNIYQYWDGDNLYHLPSHLIQVHTDDTTKVSHYSLNDDIRYEPWEIIHTKDNNSDSVYVGRSRLYSTKDTIAVLKKMLNFQENFFKNNAIPGLVIQTPNILGDKLKQKLLDSWRRRYNPEIGGKSPMILDGDLKVNPLSQTKYNELDFEDSITAHETKILKALGVPPILLDSGNNANLRPNIQLFYETTVLPIVAKIISSYERFFAYDMEPDVYKVRALRPEIREAAQYYQGLVNTGIMTINEAREEIRLDPSDEEHADELRIPANIAGSATDPNEGGRPTGEEGNDDE